MNPSGNLSCTKRKGSISGSLTQRDGMALAEGLCNESFWLRTPMIGEADHARF
jgi:hypothetical protein